MASLNAVDLEGLRGFVAIARHASFQLGHQRAEYLRRLR